MLFARYRVSLVFWVALTLPAVALASPAAAPALPAAAPAGAWPSPGSAEYCVAVQKTLASTRRGGTNTVFTDMPSYRHSKPSAQPHLIYQVVTYAGSRPIVVSCKVKTAAHLLAVYGAGAAGKQRYCPDVTRQARARAVAELRQANLPAAADKAAGMVIDANEPHVTGQAYLSDFQPSYRAPDGAVHLSSPGLFQNYDSWITPLLPEIFQGQSYCHLPTVEYIKALATGAMQPGTTVTTADDAPVQPR